MRRFITLPSLCLAAAGLSACGGTLEVSSSNDRALAPTLDRADVRAFDSEAARLNSAQRTAVRDLPSGTVRYDGQVGSNALVNGQSGFGLLGDVSVDVDFDGPREINGQVTDVNLLRNGDPIERLSGSLDVDGDQASGKLRADAEGILARSDGVGGVERTNLALELEGTVVNDAFVGDAITGSVTGFGDGYQLDGDTFNVVLEPGGSFVGTVD